MARNKSVGKLCEWFNKFQQKVDGLTKETIKFTMEIWKLSNKNWKVSKTANILGGKSTPYVLGCGLILQLKREARYKSVFQGRIQD